MEVFTKAFESSRGTENRNLKLVFLALFQARVRLISGLSLEVKHTGWFVVA